MTSHDPDGQVVIEASSGEAEGISPRLKCGNPSRVTADSFAIVDDFATETFGVVEPPDFWDRIRAHGYRSVLFVGLPVSGVRGCDYDPA
jgi:hypothetical protein